MIEAALKVNGESRLQFLSEDAVNRGINNLPKNADEKALRGTYTELYRIIERAAEKAVEIRGAEDKPSNKNGKLSVFQGSTQHMIQQHIQSPILKASGARRLKQHAEFAVARDETFRVNYIRKEADEDQSIPP